MSDYTEFIDIEFEEGYECNRNGIIRRKKTGLILKGPAEPVFLGQPIVKLTSSFVRGMKLVIELTRFPFYHTHLQLLRVPEFAEQYDPAQQEEGLAIIWSQFYLRKYVR